MTNSSVTTDYCHLPLTLSVNRIYLSVPLHSSIRICHDMSLWRHLLCIRFRSGILYLYRWNINPKTISHLSMTFTIPSAALVWQTKNVALILLRLLHQRRNKNERKNHVPLYNLCNCQYRGIIYCLVWAWISQKWVRTHARSSVISLHFSISSYPIPQSQLPTPNPCNVRYDIPNPCIKPCGWPSVYPAHQSIHPVKHALLMMVVFCVSCAQLLCVCPLKFPRILISTW